MIGPLGILAVFVFLYTLLVCAITPVILFFWKVHQRFARQNTPLIKSSVQRAYYFASVIALAPIILLAIGSVGSVGIYDVILLVLFVIVACVYIAKRTR
jgi:ABC-type xylose transport system permease subunit